LGYNAHQLNKNGIMSIMKKSHYIRQWQLVWLGIVILKTTYFMGKQKRFWNLLLKGKEQTMNTRKLFIILCMLFAVVTLFWSGTAQSQTDTKADTKVTQDKAQDNSVVRTDAEDGKDRLKKKMALHAERIAAAKRFKEIVAATAGGITTAAVLDPGGIPHYFGPYPNYANSPLPKGPIAQVTVDYGGSGYTAPTVTITDVYEVGSGATATATLGAGGVITAITLDLGGAGVDYIAPIVTITDVTGMDAAASATVIPDPGTGIRKFIDSLPLLNLAGKNNLNQYIPVAIADTTTYPDCDYYEIELGEYSEKLHTDLPPTRLRGYRQTNTTDATVSVFHYLGPLIVATRDRPVRIKFTNNLPTGVGGNLFIPVDETLMGAGLGPDGISKYTQNRATVHLHGGFTPWISDGTPHQWMTPAGETTTPYPHGVSVYNVPDMPGPGTNPLPGVLTFYYTNQQGARLMFYHDHSFGITRLNVYAGEAAGYLLTDDVEKDLINGTNVTGVNPNNLNVLPDVGIPLIIQDKTFVDPNAIAFQDPTWNGGTTPPVPNAGDLWYPHVYMPNQNPWDIAGMNAFGRWQYGPWFWPPTTGIMHGPISNPYYDPINAPWEAPQMPAAPNPSAPAEAFVDTMLVNGTAYPYIELDPKTYRLRILNAANDRFLNLQLYVADPAVTTPDGRLNTEVKMVPSIGTPGFPASWPIDARLGGVPDPTPIVSRGPAFIQIGTEGGFLPAPVIVPSVPITWNWDNPAAFDFGNVKAGGLMLGTAERADVLVDFSAYAGKTLILYNDAPAPFPAIDPRYDYFTGHPDWTGVGGTPTTLPGYGPNTRTIMQIRVSAITPDPAYNVTALNAVFAKTAAKRGVFEVSQDMIIIPEARYNSAYNRTNLPVNPYVRIFDNSVTFTPLDSATAVTLPLKSKAIHDEMGAVYDMDYGRMSSMLGLERPVPGAALQNFTPYPYIGPPLEIVKGTVFGTPIGSAADGTSVWKITHNGVDTHTVHVHLYNAQLLNRVAWDNSLRIIDANELGWKETFRIHPLQDTIVALRPTYPIMPFKIPNSIRLLDPTKPAGALLDVPPPTGQWVDPAGNAVTVVNHAVNFGWEYVFHCHLLAHEEMDMMQASMFAVPPEAPTNLTVTLSSGRTVLKWNNNSLNQTGVSVQRAKDAGFTTGLATFNLLATATTYTDNSYRSTQMPYFYRVFARNTVGDTTIYAAPAIGFPTATIDSAFSNVAGPPAGIVTQNTLLQAASPSTAPILVSWSYAPPIGGDKPPVSGFVIQRATNPGFTSGLTTFNAGAGATSYSDKSIKTIGATYYYRVAATNFLGNSNWSAILSIVN
jgi:FtsP/CotA-like multicopper oxidase with cupredoxin domain